MESTDDASNRGPRDTDNVTNPKRKSPFVQMTQAVSTLESPMADDIEDSLSPKQARKHSFDAGLPPLLPNECEVIVDIYQALAELDAGETYSDGYHRIERESSSARPVCDALAHNLHFKTVMYLSKRFDRGSTTDIVYDIGVYIRIVPPGVSWTCKDVSMMVMLINADDPFSKASHVNRDTCLFSSSDSCRGWMSMVSFTTVGSLREQGFVFGSSTVICRGQASLRGGGVCTVSDHLDTGGTLPTPSIYRGLRNLGATCYLNGLLQSLFHLAKFREIVYSSDLPTSEGRSSILAALQVVFHDLETADTVVSLEPLIKAFGWELADVGIQHDAQEMSRLLVDRIEEELRPFGGDASVQALFAGEIENYIECLDVEYRSTRTEKFYDLQLNIVTLDKTEHIGSLEEALMKYLTPEVMEGVNAYDTEEKFGKQRARKGVRFSKLPPVLTFQLMRFQFDVDTFEMEKIHSEFSFPEVLDMGEELGGEYMLHSVLVHSGNVNSGHYYAYIRPGMGIEQNAHWFKFDDDEVKPCENFSAMENNFGGPAPDNGCINYLQHTSGPDRVYSAYMLTYVRRGRLSEVMAPPGAKFMDLPICIQESIKSKRRLMGDTALLRRGSRVNLKPKISVAIASKETIFSSSDPESWFEESQEYDSSAVVGSLVGTASNPDWLVFDPTVWKMEPVDNTTSFGEISTNFDSANGLIFLECEDMPDDLHFVLVEFVQGEQFRFHSVTDHQTVEKMQRNGCAFWQFLLGGVLEPVIEEVSSGTILVFEQSPSGADPNEVLSLMKNSRHVSVILYNPTQLIAGVAVTGDDSVIATIPLLVDVNDPISSVEQHIPDFDPCTQQVLVYRANPFESIMRAKSNLNIPGSVMGDICGATRRRGEKGFVNLHCVIVPAECTSGEERTNHPRLVCIRYFSEHVTEQACHLLQISPDTSLGDLISTARSIFSEVIPSDTPLRIVEVDPHELEILEAYSMSSAESATLPVSTLSCWGTRNVFLEYIRIEADDPSETTKCYHYDRAIKKNCRQPFLLNLPADLDGRYLAISEKLEIPLAVVRTWRIVETEVHGETLLEIAHNQSTSNHSTPRPLTIRR